MAVSTRLGSLLPFGEGMKEASEGRPKARRGVYGAHCGVIAWRGRCVVVIVRAVRSGGAGPWERRRLRLVRLTCRRLQAGRIGDGREEGNNECKLD